MRQFLAKCLSPLSYVLTVLNCARCRPEMGFLSRSLLPFWKELRGHAVVVHPMAGYMIVITVRWCAVEYQSDIVLANHRLCCSIKLTVDG